VTERDPIAARMHERTAEWFRKAAERLRLGGFTDGAEAAKRVAREEETRAAETDVPKR
jgi:hypothetical protein